MCVSKHYLGVTNSIGAFPWYSTLFWIKIYKAAVFYSTRNATNRKLLLDCHPHMRCPNKSEVDGFLDQHPIRSPEACKR